MNAAPVAPQAPIPPTPLPDDATEWDAAAHAEATATYDAAREAALAAANVAYDHAIASLPPIPTTPEAAPC